jgi:hypothetical protein
MGPLGAILRTGWFDLLILALEMQAIEQVEIVLFGIGVQAYHLGRELPVY